MVGKFKWFPVILWILLVLESTGSVHAETVRNSAMFMEYLDFSDIPQWPWEIICLPLIVTGK